MKYGKIRHINGVTIKEVLGGGIYINNIFERDIKFPKECKILAIEARVVDSIKRLNWNKHTVFLAILSAITRDVQYWETYMHPKKGWVSIFDTSNDNLLRYYNTRWVKKKGE